MPATSATPLIASLEAAGARLTRPRRVVAELIGARRGHFTAADLEADARRSHRGIGRATVFRSLELLSSLGAVERLDLPSGEHAYIACEAAHHHHVVCSTCGRSSDFDDAELSNVVDAVARRTGYLIDSHRLELFGTCPDCTRPGAVDRPA